MAAPNTPSAAALGAPDTAAPGGDVRRPERRRNAALRELIDEMLVSIRVAVNRDLWSPNERSQYERELSEIMTRVRAETVKH